MGKPVERWGRKLPVYWLSRQSMTAELLLPAEYRFGVVFLPNGQALSRARARKRADRCAFQEQTENG